MATPRPQSKADIDDGFQTRLHDLAQQVGDSGTAASQGQGGTWAITTGPTVTDLAGLAAPFSRETINAAYEQVHSDADTPGTVGDAAALTIQADWLAVLERAYRVRSTTPCRDIVHMAARQRGHGHGAGVLQTGVLGYVQNLLAAGKTRG